VNVARGLLFNSESAVGKEDNCKSCSEVSPPGIVAVNDGARASAQTTLTVQGMDCADEVESLKRALTPLQGVKEIKVNLMAGRVIVAHDSSVNDETLIKAVSTAGLKAFSSKNEVSDTFASEGSQRRRILSVLISGSLTGIGLLADRLGFPTIEIPAFFAAVISGGWFIFPKALRALRQRSLDMNVLMTVAVAGAMMIGEWSEAAAVTFLFALSEALEAFSLNRARKAIKALLKLAPETALVKRGSTVEEVSVQEISIGDTILVRSGAKIPLDGEVLSGDSSVNQAPITGESMPVAKGRGDIVYAGTLNEHGSLEVKVTKLFADTTLAKIIDLVEEAQATKAPSQQFVDRFARVYTPSVFIVAVFVLVLPPLLFGGTWETWIYRSLVFLVIACPCALVISTPVSIVSGLTAMARSGVLIKGGTFLEAIGRLKALAVDKTGTITEGKPRVQQIYPIGSSTIGIAMGQAGTDTAIETADIALMQDDLLKVAEAVSLGKRTLRIIQGNIAFALGVKAVFLVLAFFGYTSLWLAILADTGATLIVIANALRLLRRN
jgi:Cd2+/Zn2+-exporting ATPase